MAVTRDRWLKDLNVEALRPPFFFRSVEEVDAVRPPHPQAHSMRRAWHEMGLDGILCVGNAPAVYFRRGGSFDDATIRDVHRKVWNQGIAPVLVLISDAKVQVLSGLTPPAAEGEKPLDDGRLVELLDRTADVMAVQNLVRRVELGDLFREHSRCFDPRRRVDRHLLDNLGQARTLLGAEEPALPGPTMHALLGRVIFISYLVDREIISRDYFAACGANGCRSLLDLLSRYSLGRAKAHLYRLFSKLKADFNGDLFDADLEAEARRVQAGHLDVLRRFLSDEELATGQWSLGFSAYDFRFIPIETISAIYERFLDAEDAEGRRETGAYYTPRFLAEAVLDIATEGLGPLLGRRFLDPSCGSGIFLVGIFNRLAEEWRARNPRVTNLKRATALIELLKENVFGVDSSETACRIASLSLYLALLDQLSPRDIQDLQAEGRMLPRLVWRGLEDGSGVPGNILRSDFFGSALTLPEDGFDLVVGNPPWARAAGPTSLAETWCRERGLAIAQRQFAYAFAWKAPTHLRPDGRVCLVLPAATIFNHQERALRFQAQWLSEFTMDLVLNLADLCFYLFDGADRPAAVFRYRSGRPGRGASFPYVVPKTDFETLRAELLNISDLDRTELRLSEVLRDLRAETAPLAWKQAMWATPRGRKFLDRLREYPTLRDRLPDVPDNKDRWEFGEGFNLFGKGTSTDRPILHALLFLPTEAVSRYVLSVGRAKPRPRAFNPRYIGKESIFKAPHIVFAHGVPRTGERLKVAYCSFDCSFEHSLRGIHAPAESEDDLRFLACALSSPLALYFFFHTAASWGTERAKIHVAEYERFPFPKADTAERRAALAEAVAVHRRLEAEEESNPFYAALVDEREHVLDNLIYEYYEVDSAERLLIEDTVNVWIPSATPRPGACHLLTLEISLPSRRDRYTRLLVQTLTSWLARKGKGVTAKVISSSATSLGIVCLRMRGTQEKQIEGEHTSSSSLDEVLARLRRLVPRQYGSVREMRDLKVFDGADLYAIKPLAARFWTDTAALNDADELMASMAFGAEGGT